MQPGKPDDKTLLALGFSTTWNLGYCSNEPCQLRYKPAKRMAGTRHITRARQRPIAARVTSAWAPR